jgi:hypothetical protein
VKQRRPLTFAVAGVLLLALAALGASSRLVGADQLRTTDGLTLKLDERGAVTSLGIEERELLRPVGWGGLFLADVADVPSEERELLRNPGFEEIGEAGPVGWTWGDEWTVETELPHSGRYSMRVMIPGPEERSSSSLATEVGVTPNTPYGVSMWMRTKGSAPHLYIEQYDAAGNPRATHPQITVSHARYNADWFRLSHEFTTAPFCRKIRVRTCLWQQTGTAWIDDVSVVCLDDDYVPLQHPVLGEVARTEEGVRLSGESEGIELSAEYRAAEDHIRLHCDLRDTTGRDRAVSVAFRLPIHAEGWRWYDDIHHDQPIEPGVRYGAGRLVGPRRVTSLYPFAAIGDDRSALALAVPMDQPRAFRLCYDSRYGYFVTYEFGLTQAAKKLPGRAWFDVILYRIDPAWGFRSAAERYYRIFPRFFTKRVQVEGAAGFMADEEALKAPEFLMPRFAIFNRQRPIEPYRERGTGIFSYAEVSGWWGWAIGINPEQAEEQPEPADAWAYVEQVARGEAGGENTQKVAECILNCSPYDREGKRRLNESYVSKWGGYNYLCNPDPEIEGPWGKVNRFTLTYEREVSQVDAHDLDGMYLDSAFVFAVDNFRCEHFQWSDHPLAFDHLSKKPVLPLAFSIHECAKAIADDMHERGKLVMSNYSVTNGPTNMFAIQFIDIIGNEMLWTWCTDAKLALQRTLAHQKTVSMSWQEAKNDWSDERVEREMKQAMFYGTFYYLSRMNRDAYERWAPLTQRLAAAGWEPLTYARPSDKAVMVERFGSAERHNLHFTLRNDTSEDRDLMLELHAEPLELPATSPPQVCTMPGGSRTQPLPVRSGRGVWRVPVRAPAQDTVVLCVPD